MKHARIPPALLVCECSPVPATEAGSFFAKLLTASQLQAFQSTIIISLLHFGTTEWVSGSQIWKEPSQIPAAWHCPRDSICCGPLHEASLAVPPNETLNVPHRGWVVPKAPAEDYQTLQLTGSPCPGSSWASWANSPQSAKLGWKHSFFSFSGWNSAL